MTQGNLIARFAFHQGIHWSITGVMIPVLVLVFQSRGLSLTEVGLVMGTWGITTMLLEVPLGGIADQFGRRRIYLLSLVINAIAAVVLLLASNLSFMLLSAALFGASRAIYSGTLDAWFYDKFQTVSGSHSFHSALALVNVVVTLGLAFGALVGGYLPDLAVQFSLSTQSMYDLNMLVVIAMNGALFALTFLLIPTEDGESAEGEAEPAIGVLKRCQQAFNASISHTVLLRVLQTTLVFGMVLSAVENLWQPYLAEIIKDSGYGTEVFGILSALYFLMATCSSLFSVRLLSWLKGSHRKLLFVSYIAAGTILVLLAFSASLLTFAAGYLLFFFLFTLGGNSQSVLLNDHTQAQYRSTMLSISSLVVTVGGVVASVSFGYIADLYGIAVSWWLGALLLMLSSLLFLRIPEAQASAMTEMESL